MGREEKREKEFLQNLDDILAGKEVKVDSTSGKEYQETIEFARKMAELGKSPSEVFQARLKAHLLQKLEEQKAITTGETQNWFSALLSRLVPRQMVWQAVTAVVVLAIAVSGALWATGILGPSDSYRVVSPAPSIPTTPTTPTAPMPAPVPPPSSVSTGQMLVVSASTGQASYLQGEKVRIEFMLTNVTSQPLTVEPFPPIVSIMDAETQKPVRTLIEGRGSRAFNPGETIEYEVVWDQRDAGGEYVPWGDYYLEMEDVNYKTTRSIQLNLTNPVVIDIRPRY